MTKEIKVIKQQLLEALATVERLSRTAKPTGYRKPRAFQSYIERKPSLHQSEFPNWRERMIVGPYHAWEYDEFEREFVAQSKGREVVLVYTRETVCICRPPCQPRHEHTR